MDTSPAAAPEALAELRRLAAQVIERDDFAQVIESLQQGHSGTLGGVWGSARALVAAALASHCPGPLFIVTPHHAEVDKLLGDLRLFTELPATAFPAWQSDTKERVLHDEVYGQRLRVLKSLVASPAEGEPPNDKPSPPSLSQPRQDPAKLIVTSIHGLMQPVPARDQLADATKSVRVGQTLAEDELTRWLVDRGCHATSAVELPGEFAVRGGIVDVFPPDEDHPVRIEFFGDEVESIRRFDVATQRSQGTADMIAITLLEPSSSDRAHVTLYAPPESWFLLVEPTDLTEEGKFYLERTDDPRSLHNVRTSLAEVYKFPSVTAAGVPAGSLEQTCHLGFESVERLSGDIQRVRDELASITVGQMVYVVCPTEAETQRLEELFDQTPLFQERRLKLLVGDLSDGFRVVSQQAIVLSSAELFNRHDSARGAIRQVAGRAIDTFLELREGDLVVHITHGIGRYRGIKLLDKEGRKEEHLDLEYHGGTRIYVPASKIELVQKYIGGKAMKAPLARIGGKAWVRQKMAAEKAVTDLASDMLELQARRDAQPGIAFPTDTPWQVEFDAAFPYEETDDQLTAIAAIKEDMIRAQPMDRLLCGDVGFGKTELAIRATFKTVDAGYQVAVLAPTTVLAEQHRQTFSERMAEFPFEIDGLSRFCTAKEQRETLQRAREGKVDIVIGTHRLASGDVEFANLGLLIIDEEQRFGVAVKERLKAMRSAVDVLTMTATPIPRTLHMALLGARAISNLETPPSDRLAVETRVTRFNEEMVRHAMLRELNRGGQAYFVHNRVHDIHAVAQRLQAIVPEARIGIGHGQMPDGQLEDVMVKFVAHEYDILLATTIIESGLDIPNANTIFIDDADRYGLADLHQLRGRVGRANRRSYCYLLIQEDRQLTPEAARRLRAVEEFSQLGAGFALSMRDLEIRGAGNLLGTQQSGHIATVGYEMYCSMLEKAVRYLRKLPPKDSVEVSIDLPVEAYLPGSYIPDMRSKIDLYRRLARASATQEVDDFAGELADRFGAPPPPVERLLELARLRISAHGWGVQTIRREDNYLVFAYAQREKIRELVDLSAGRLRIADAQSAYLPLEQGRTGVDELLEQIKSLLRPHRSAA